MRDPTYEAIRVEDRSLTTSYDDLTIQCLAEFLRAEWVRKLLLRLCLL